MAKARDDRRAFESLNRKVVLILASKVNDSQLDEDFSRKGAKENAKTQRKTFFNLLCVFASSFAPLREIFKKFRHSSVYNTV